MSKPKYNRLKKHVLRVLAEEEHWSPVPAIARKVHLPYAARSLYPYVRRLAEYGLVEAAGAPGRRVYYRITERGKKRLEFLTKAEQAKD